MSTDDLVLAHLQAKEPEQSKTEMSSDQVRQKISQSRVRQKGGRQIKVTTLGIKWEKGKQATSDNHLGLGDEVRNVYVTDLLDKRCDVVNTEQLMYK